MYRTDFWTLWEKTRVGCFERTASKHVYYLGWNGSPAQVGWMRQVLGAGALGRPRGIRWRGRWEGGSGWGIHVNLWLIHVNVWQKPLQSCKVISLQLIKINGKKKEELREKIFLEKQIKSILSKMNIATPFSLLFILICMKKNFHLLPFSLCMPFLLKLFSCKQHIDKSCVFYLFR